MNPLAALNSRTSLIDPWNHQDPSALPPAPCRSIPLTDELRAADAAQQAERESKSNLTWSRPAPVALRPYSAPAKAHTPRKASQPASKQASKQAKFWRSPHPCQPPLPFPP